MYIMYIIIIIETVRSKYKSIEDDETILKLPSSLLDVICNLTGTKLIYNAVNRLV